MKGYFNLTELCNKNKCRVDHLINYKCIDKNLLITFRGKNGGTYYPDLQKNVIEQYFENKKATPQYYAIYAIYDSVYTKIGITHNIKKRIKMLQCGNPNKLILIDNSRLIINARKKEIELHKKYKNKHILNEWFNLSPSEQQELKQYLKEI